MVDGKSSNFQAIRKSEDHSLVEEFKILPKRLDH